MKKKYIITAFPFAILFIQAVAIMTMVLNVKTPASRLLYSLAPLPIVFSKRPGPLPKYEYFKYEYIDEDSNTSIRIFNRYFYKSLKGPHRNKLIYFTMLTSNRMINNVTYRKAYKNLLCHNKMLLNSFELRPNIKKIRVKQGDEVIREFKCF